MKNIVLTVLSIVFVFSISTAEAQSLSKKERRALKKEIKTYKKNPEKWVKMQKSKKSMLKHTKTLSSNILLYFSF